MGDKDSDLTKGGDAPVPADSGTMPRLFPHHDPFDAIPDAVFIHDYATGVVLDINKAGIEMFGYPRDELLKTGPNDCSLGSSPYSAKEAFDWVCKAKEEGPQRFEWVSKRKSGELFPSEILVSKCDIGGEPHIIAVVRDITERKQADEALRESEERFRVIFEHASEGICLVEVETGRLVYGNPTFCRMMGYTLDELGEILICDLYPQNHKEKVLREFASMVPGERALMSNSPCVRKDKEQFFADVAIAVAPFRGVNHAVGLFTDITDRKELEAQMRQSEKMQAIGQLAGGVAHDFNNQLSAIVGYADLLSHGLAGQERLSMFVDNILSSALKARDLTTQLLAFARKGKYRTVPLDVHELVTEVASLLERSIDKRIKLTKRFEAERSTVLGDPSQLQNAILSLGLNARDAMPGGGELTFATQVVSLSEDDCRKSPFDIDPGDYLRVCVTDTGIGMEKATCERAFEPFFTTKKQGRGTGMGLAAVYGTVTNHHGVIAVYSEPGRGSTFTIDLPLLADVPEHRVHRVENEEKILGGTGHILVVDDEPSVRETASLMLEQLGYTVTACADGGEAVKLYESRPESFDAVMLDMIMPVLGGRETYQKLRAINPDVRVLLCSGYSLDGEAKEIIAMGAVEFIQKPFRILELSTKVAGALG